MSTPESSNSGAHNQTKSTGELEHDPNDKTIANSDTYPNRPGEQGDQIADQVSQKQHRGAWIRYRTEYKDPVSGKVIHRRDSRTPTAEELLYTRQEDEPIFDHVTTYKARSSSNKESPRSSADRAEDDVEPPRALGQAASYSMLIYSTAIINAIQAAVVYYPSQELSGDVLRIDWPYRVLVHHYDELVTLQNQAMLKGPEDLCVRERDAAGHLQLLIQFLDDAVMGDIKAEAERIKRGVFTYEHLWYAYRPGCVVLSCYKQSDASDWDAFVVQGVSGGPSSESSGAWVIVGWKLSFDGTLLNRQEMRTSHVAFTGERVFRTLNRFIYAKAKINDEEAQRKIDYGKKYWKLVQKQCQHYRGKSCDFPYNEIDGLVMTDMKQFYTQYSLRKPRSLDRSDLRNWMSDCTCSVCKQGKGISQLTRNDWSTFDTKSAKSKLTSADYLLCPYEIPAFVFRTRTWENLHVNNFNPAEFDQSMIDSLVTNDQSRVNLLKALAKCFARENSAGGSIEREPWSADYVKGKGNGLIFLLHGRPGVGKTFTAECIAEYTKRPLMVLTSSDIGTDPSRVEQNLTANFKTATSWGAVLLIDEADVFMERRSTADLARNSLVAGFLRALEFYEGILFLTTNRVGAFDDAFISRVHIKLYYPDFTDSERKKVWATFVKKLQKERENYMRVTVDAKEYIESKQLRDIAWNGREIRNAFQTAVSLAEYENKRDEEGNIMLTDTHLKSVVELSKDFKKYLDDLHLADEGNRALARMERNDAFGS